MWSRIVMLHPFVFEAIILLSLVACVFTRSFGNHQGAWRPGGRKHRFHTDSPWDPTIRKRDHIYSNNPKPEECCPSVDQIVQPLGGVSKSGRILELYRDQNSTQSFYQTSCKEGVKGNACKYIDEPRRMYSTCVQKYSYTYALVREFDSDAPWRLDYIRIRSGCSCEIRYKGHHHHGKRARRIEEFL